MTINVIFQSQNNKIIEVTDLNTFNKVNSSLATNESLQLDYSNYLIDIKSSASSFTIDNAFTNVSAFNDDIIFVILFVGLFIIAFAGIEFLKRLSK